MRDTPILIPIILAVCLGTLAYLLYAALSTTVAPDPSHLNAPLTRNEAAPPAQNLPPAHHEDINKPSHQPPPVNTPEQLDKPDEATQDDTRINTDTRNRYSVLAGSFRQLANAKIQVSKLKNAGFKDAEIIRSTGGTYAMAVAGWCATEAEAEELLRRVTAKGFDARVLGQ